MNILIAYSSKYGSTAEIASVMGTEIAKHGHSANVLEVSQVPDASAYDAIILGSPLYAGNWRSDAKKWLEAQMAILSGKPVMYFSVGLSPDTDLSQIAKATMKQRSLINPVAEGYFTGRMDIEKLDVFSRTICKIMKAPTKDQIDKVKIAKWIELILNKLASGAR